MSDRQRIVTDVPDDRVGFIVATMRADGATVSKQQQPDGLWTITGDFPVPMTGTAGAPRIAPPVDQPAGEPPRQPTAALTTSQPSAADVDALARTLWGEARGGSRLGLEAVAAVVLHRVKRNRPQRFGDGVAGVCRMPMQFSCWNEGDPNLPKLLAVTANNAAFVTCLEVAERALQGLLADPVSGADHYHTAAVAPAWARGHTPTRRIDDHLFYNDIP